MQGCPYHRRANRLFGADGKSFMLALDAHSFSPSPQNVDRAVSLVPRMSQLGVNAVLVPYGIASRRANSLDEVGLVLRCDASTNVFDPSVPSTHLVHGAIDAVRTSADAVVAMTFLGAEEGLDGQVPVRQLIASAHDYGIPVIIESLPYTFDGVGTPGWEPRNVAVAARFAEEMGADIVKTRLTGSDEDTRIVGAVSIPILALGGPKTGLQDYLEFLSRCLECGVSGVAVGRNIVDDASPLSKVAAMAAIIHHGKSVTEALRIYEESQRGGL